MVNSNNFFYLFLSGVILPTADVNICDMNKPTDFVIMRIVPKPRVRKRQSCFCGSKPANKQKCEETKYFCIHFGINSQ